MALEFLYSADDIPLFVGNLYDNGYYLSRSAGLHKDQPLSHADAVSALASDLLLPGSKMYWVGKEEHAHILQLNSCGKQSHPCYVGKQGRIAGYLSSSIQNETKSEALNLQKTVGAYLRKNGSFQRYNANARMSCYFLLNYSNLEETYLKKPFPDHICRGVIRILCKPAQTAALVEKIEKISEYFPAIEVGRVTANEYWADHNVSDVYYEFLCNHALFSFSDLQRLVLWVSENRKSAAYNQKLQMIAESPPMSAMRISLDQPSITIFIDNPWQCWVNHENDYSGRPVIIWPGQR